MLVQQGLGVLRALHILMQKLHLVVLQYQTKIKHKSIIFNIKASFQNNIILLLTMISTFRMSQAQGKENEIKLMTRFWKPVRCSITK